MRRIFFGIVLILALASRSITGAPPPTQIADNAPAANQAPDEVIKKLSNLIHAGKYAEAQQLTTGLLLAYPEDQRLIKAKTLLDQLPTTPNPANIGADNGQAPKAPAPARAENTADEIVGVGMGLAIDSASLTIKVISIIPNSPAARAGLAPGLILDSVDGVSTEAKSLTEVVGLVRGVAGTKVQLAFSQSEGKEPVRVELIRQKIALETDSNPAQLTGMEKVEYNSLIELARQAQENTDLDQQKILLKQFMTDSAAFLSKHPKEMLLWQLRAASALSLDDPDAAYEAGQRLLAAGAADSNDPNAQQLLARLKIKGWLNKEGVEASKRQAEETKRHSEDYEKYGWLLGDWGSDFSFFSTAAFDYGQKRGHNEVTFLKNGLVVEGYVTVDGKRFDTPAYQFIIPDSAESISSGNWKISSGKGRRNKWQPITSFSINGDRRMMTIVWGDHTYVLSKLRDSQGSEESPQAEQPPAQTFFSPRPQ